MWKYFFLEKNKKLRWIFCFACPAYVVLFTSILQPLKSDYFHYNYSVQYDFIAFFCYFTLIVFGCIYLPYQFPSFFHGKSWTFSRFVIWLFVCVLVSCSISFILDFYIYQFPLDSAGIFTYLFDFQFFVDIFTVLPIVLFFLASPSFLGVQNENDFAQNTPYEVQIAKKTKLEDKNDIRNILSFNDKNNNKEFRIDFDKVYFITPTFNYIDIVFKNESDIIEKTTLRGTLKAVEEQNMHLNDLFRCHKTYIVNCQKVKSVYGNARGYYLHLDDVEEEIPVSRHKNSLLVTLFPSFF